MKLINVNINRYFHRIPLWKSPIKLPLELPVELPVEPPVGPSLPTQSPSSTGPIVIHVVPLVGFWVYLLFAFVNENYNPPE